MRSMVSIVALAALPCAICAQTTSRTYWVLAQQDDTWCGYANEAAFKSIVDTNPPLESARLTYASHKLKEVTYQANAESGDWIVIDTYTPSDTATHLRRANVFVERQVEVFQDAMIRDGKASPFRIVNVASTDPKREADTVALDYPDMPVRTDLHATPYVAIADEMRARSLTTLCKAVKATQRNNAATVRRQIDVSRIVRRYRGQHGRVRFRLRAATRTPPDRRASRRTGCDGRRATTQGCEHPPACVTNAPRVVGAAAVVGAEPLLDGIAAPVVPTCFASNGCAMMTPLAFTNRSWPSTTPMEFAPVMPNRVTRPSSSDTATARTAPPLHPRAPRCIVAADTPSIFPKQLGCATTWPCSREPSMSSCSRPCPGARCTASRSPPGSSRAPEDASTSPMRRSSRRCTASRNVSSSPPSGASPRTAVAHAITA